MRRRVAVLGLCLLWAGIARSAALGQDSVFPLDYLGAMRLLERGDAAGAFPELLSITRNNPAFHPAVKSLVRCAWRAGDAQVAETERLFSGRKNLPGIEGANALMGLALLESGLGRDDRSLELLGLAFQKEPRSIAAPLEAAYVFQRMRRKAFTPQDRAALEKNIPAYFSDLEKHLAAGEKREGGGLSLARAVLLLDEGRTAEAAKLARNAMERQETLEEKRGAAVSRFWAAVMLDRDGRFREAENLYGAAASYFESARDYWNAAEALMRLALLRQNMLDGPGALGALSRSRLMLSRVEGTERQAAVLGFEAILRQSQGDFAGALRLNEKILDRAREAGDELARARALGNMAGLWSEMGEQARGVALVNAALEIFMRRGDPAAATALANRGTMEIKAGLYARAEASLRQAAGMFVERNDGAGALLANINLAELKRERGDFLAALALFDSCVADAQGAANMLAVFHARHGRAAALAELGRWPEASEESARALTLASGGSLDDQIWSARHVMARALDAQGRHTEALPIFRKAVVEVEALRSAMGGGEQREGFFASRLSLYEDFSASLLKSGEDPQSPAATVFHFPEILVSREHRFEAFRLSERMRARGLLERMGAAGLAANSPELSPELVSRLRETQARLQWLRGKVR